MKFRSKALWQYLNDTGALQGTPEDIERAKRSYRREYKRKWRQNKIIKPIELRPGFTAKEYRELKIAAKMAGMTPTIFIKRSALASLGMAKAIPEKIKLLTALQLVSMASIAIFKAKHGRAIDMETVANSIEQAEKVLLEYLKD